MSLFAVLMLAGVIGLAAGAMSGWDSETGDGTPSVTTLSLVAGLGMVAFAIAAVARAALALFSARPVGPEVKDRAILGAAWALLAAFMLFGALFQWVRFLPLSDYAQPVAQLVLASVGSGMAAGSGRLFRRAMPRLERGRRTESVPDVDTPA
jgi:hypothetical protein